MKNMYDLSKEFGVGLIGMYRTSGFNAVVQEMKNRIHRMKDEILVAWFAYYGFEPGRAVIVEEQTEKGLNIYIRERTVAEIAVQPNIESVLKSKRYSLSAAMNSDDGSMIVRMVEDENGEWYHRKDVEKF